MNNIIFIFSIMLAILVLVLGRDSMFKRFIVRFDEDAEKK